MVEVIPILNYFVIGCWPALLALFVGFVLVVLFRISAKIRNFFGLTFFAIPGTVLILFGALGLFYSVFEIRNAILKQREYAYNLIKENEDRFSQSLKNGSYLETSKILQEIVSKANLAGARVLLKPTNNLAAEIGDLAEGNMTESTSIESNDIDGGVVLWAEIKYQVKKSSLQQSISGIAENWWRTMIWITIATLICAVALGLFIFRHLKRSSKFVKDLNQSVSKAKNIEELLHGVESVEYENAVLEEEVDLRNNFESIVKGMAGLNARWLKAEADAVVGRIATQVAHDIRSPLSVLNIVTSSLHDISDENRYLIRESVKRIDAIANDLLGRSKLSSHVELGSQKNGNVQKNSLKNQLETFSVKSIVEGIAAEKRIQFGDKAGIRITTDMKGLEEVLAKGNALAFGRIISNLVNNSVEAFENETGELTIGVREYEDQTLILLVDNGKGIPEHVLKKLGERGVTHGKDASNSGSGLGVHHAKTNIVEWGGLFQIRSRTGYGTSVEIRLPRIK